MSKKTIALDKDEAVLFETQTTYVQTKALEVKHRAFVAFEIFSVDFDVPSGSETVEWRYFDAVGTAKIIADYAKDFPRVELLAKKATAQIRGLGNSYGYTIPEIRRAQRNGVNLDARKAIEARKFHDIGHDIIAWKGDATYGLQGFINYPGTSEVVLPVGASTFKTWSTKTADEIIKDFRLIVSSGRTITSSRETPDTVIMPTAQYDLIEGLRLSVEMDKSVLTYLKETYPQITIWKGVTELDGAGAGGLDRIMVFDRSAEHVQYTMPQMFEQMEPEREGMEYTTVCHSESGGIKAYYPVAILWADGL